MNSLNRAALGAAAGGCLLLASPSVLAAAGDTEAGLRAQVQQQAKQLREQASLLEQLSARLAALEGTAQSTGAAPSSGAGVDAQLAAAIADTRQDDMAILQAQVAQLAATGGGGGGNVRWRKGGPEFRSSDGQFTFHPRGRVMVDFSSTHGSAFDARNITGTDLASGRLGAEGRMGPLGYKIDADFAGNDVSLKDTYLSWDTRVSGLPTEIYVGNKLKDRGLDGSTSGVNTPFMQRNAVASVGAQQSGYYGLGVTTKVIGDGWHASVAVTGDDIGNDSTASDTVAYLLRAHWNPLRGQAGFVHLGGLVLVRESRPGRGQHQQDLSDRAGLERQRARVGQLHRQRHRQPRLGAGAGRSVWSGLGLRRTNHPHHRVTYGRLGRPAGDIDLRRLADHRRAPRIQQPLRGMGHHTGIAPGAGRWRWRLRAGCAL